jgi:ammonia channel protein AmtB
MVHMTAGIAGFVGAYLTGPRLCKFHRESTIEYFLDPENFQDKILPKSFKEDTVIREKLEMQNE